MPASWKTGSEDGLLIQFFDSRALRHRKDLTGLEKLATTGTTRISRCDEFFFCSRELSGLAQAISTIRIRVLALAVRATASRSRSQLKAPTWEWCESLTDRRRAPHISLLQHHPDINGHLP